MPDVLPVLSTPCNTLIISVPPTSLGCWLEQKDPCFTEPGHLPGPGVIDRGKRLFSKAAASTAFAEPLRQSPAVPLRKARFRETKTAQHVEELGNLQGNKGSDANG